MNTNENNMSKPVDQEGQTPNKSARKENPWWWRTFGRRGLLQLVIGDLFADKNNAASVIAIILVATLCYLVAFKEKYDLTAGMMNVVFVVIGYYFGAKRNSDDKEE
ncbi:hypothetical protein PAQ31011_02135 [Pandoraea aquatica]|uniref:Uncharacterized protein n=2 Tax=Pandoraea aquatica TaxID=2508290 RepID=A0A5E4UR47_9BURK|nr:hypothetical protein PAQ31011_02135 [Pandoraea aquatica]